MGGLADVAEELLSEVAEIPWELFGASVCAIVGRSLLGRANRVGSGSLLSPRTPLVPPRKCHNCLIDHPLSKSGRPVTPA